MKIELSPKEEAEVDTWLAEHGDDPLVIDMLDTAKSMLDHFGKLRDIIEDGE